jgi:hypothetical protein
MVINRLTCLLPVDDVHPPDGFRLTHPAQIGLGGLQILVPQNHFRDDLQGDPIPTGISGRMPPEVVGPDRNF